jgi:thymidylate synthase ThyX
MSEEVFSSSERDRLAIYFTNLDRSVFGLRLPQEVAGALFSRYSRSGKGLRRIFLDEFIGEMGAFNSPAEPDDTDALKKARAFYDRVLVGYGDDSVAQLGGAHIACEGISNVAAKLLEDARIGIAPLEKSTRYVRFDQKDRQGNYLFYKEPKLMGSVYRQAYLDLMQLLFETYSEQIEPMIEFIRSQLPIKAVEMKHPRTGQLIPYDEITAHPELKKSAEAAYRATVRAHACDVLRSYLPAATLTNVGLFGVGQSFEYLLTKLYTNNLTEARQLAASMRTELNRLIPSFVKRSKFSDYLADTDQIIESTSQNLTGGMPVDPVPQVTLVDFDQEAEEKIISAILYPHARHSLGQLRRLVSGMAATERAKVLDEYIARRQSRRDKPGRAFENVYYTFDIIGNLGIYRDLHRHRILTQEAQSFSTYHGYDTPREIDEIGYKSSFDQCMERAAALYEKIHRDFPLEAQYLVPFAYRVRWYMKMNLREAVHIAELRSMPQGHPDYRVIAQDMWRKISQVHPTLASYANFIDWKTYRLGRLQSEMRTEYKKSAQAQSSVPPS